MIPKNTSIQTPFHNFDIKKIPGGELKINTFEPLNSNISFTEENMPTLQSHLEDGQSAELCSLKINKGHLHGEFYSQWEIEADDPEERKILEHLRANDKLKKLGMLSQEDVVSPKELLSPQNPEDRFQLRDHQRGSTPHKMASKKSQENLRENPDLSVMRQLSSPEPKKMKKVLSCLSEGETLISEFIQEPILERESSSKSSRNDSHLEFEDFTHDPNLSGIVPKRPETLRSRRGNLVRYECEPEKYSPNPIITNDQTANANTKQNTKNNNKSDLKNSELVALYRKRELEVQRPVRFNVIVVGQSGLGKSTFIDAFLDKKYSTHVIRPSTQEIVEREGTRYENGIKFRINFIDTPGYGQNKDFKEWYKMIKNYVTAQFRNYKEQKKSKLKEKKISQNPVEDRRVHALLYFLAGPRIAHNDLIAMKKLKKYCNIIPILAKGDALTIQEIKEMKLNLIKEAHDYKIEWFDFAEALKDSPHKLKELTEGKFGPSPPFLLISSVNKIEISPNQFVFGR